MKALLNLSHLNVENANAIAGLTYGFPAMTNLTGFTHALSRKLNEALHVTLGGCAVVCHQHQVHMHQPSGRGDHVFSLTRNPLTKKGETASFIEEGRMHMDISLIIECHFDGQELNQEMSDFEKLVEQLVYRQNLAGGMIKHIGKVSFVDMPDSVEEQDKIVRSNLRKLLPGFILVDRNDLLQEHFEALQRQNPETELFDAWLDFFTLKYQAIIPDEEQNADKKQAVSWELQSKPASGWLVPIVNGFKPISQLYEPGQVSGSRDPSTPFCFVEPTYSVGQWLSPHRIRDHQSLHNIFWWYKYEQGWYGCQNQYKPEHIETNPLTETGD